MGSDGRPGLALAMSHPCGSSSQGAGPTQTRGLFGGRRKGSQRKSKWHSVMTFDANYLQVDAAMVRSGAKRKLTEAASALVSLPSEQQNSSMALSNVPNSTNTTTTLSCSSGKRGASSAITSRVQLWIRRLEPAHVSWYDSSYLVIQWAPPHGFAARASAASTPYEIKSYELQWRREHDEWESSCAAQQILGCAVSKWVGDVPNGTNLSFRWRANRPMGNSIWSPVSSILVEY